MEMNRVLYAPYTVKYILPLNKALLNNICPDLEGLEIRKKNLMDNVTKHL